MSYLSHVADRSRVPLATLVTWVESPERTSSMPFNTADELLCACSQWELWHTDLHEYYVAVDLTWTQCANPRCRKEFRTTKHHHGPEHEQRYCSQACYQESRVVEKDAPGALVCANPQCGQSFMPGGKGPDKYCSVRCRTQVQNKRRVRTCSKGHDWTPENTIFLKNGKRRCRTCNNATSANGYRRRKLAA